VNVNKKIQLLINVLLCCCIIFSSNLYAYTTGENANAVFTGTQNETIISQPQLTENHINALIFEDEEVFESKEEVSKELPSIILSIFVFNSAKNARASLAINSNTAASPFFQFIAQHIPLHVAFRVFTI